MLAAGSCLVMGATTLAQVRPASTTQGWNGRSIQQLDRIQSVKQRMMVGGVAGAPCPNPDHDCYTAGTPGCSDEVCCDTVCACDPFCCTTAWDAYCAGNGFVPGCGAIPLCGAPPACDPPNPNEECETAFDGGVIPAGGSVVFSGSAQCASPDCASFPIGQGNLWIKFSIPETRQITLEYCGSVGQWGNAWLNLALGCPCTGFTSAASFAFSCPDTNLQMTWASLPAGEYYYPVMIDPAFGSIGDYTITVSSAKAGPTCPIPGDHDCCVQGGPGCNDQACCDLVCAADPFCCNSAWDQLCVNAAVALCACVPPPVCPNPEHDCLTTGTPGCSDQACCETVCAVDPFCCQTAWDTICVNEAATMCGFKAPANDLCADRIAIGEVCQMPFNTVGAVTDGPAHVACEDGFADQFVNQDIWYNYTPSCSGDVTVSLCGSAYDTKLAVYDGCSCELSDANLIDCEDDTCGLQSSITFAATAGNCYKIRVGGFGPLVGSGQLTITNSGVPCTSGCVSDVDNNGVTNVDDLLIIINGWGPCNP
jgi:hypothetical protein